MSTPHRSGRTGSPVAPRLSGASTDLMRWGRTRGISALIAGLSSAARLHPKARPARHGVRVIRDLPYTDSSRPEHRLDIYVPASASYPLPVVFYVHGGGFQSLSKETHFFMALAFARRGYLVVNVDYRLAPRHPYPAAIADVCRAYHWACAHVGEYGGDRDRLAPAGESAGANLVTALCLAVCYPRPEPWAARAFASGIVPRAVLPAAGLLQVSDGGRFARRRRLPNLHDQIITDVERAYLRGVDRSRPGALDLADPLLVLERGDQPARALPPFFVPVGTRDPVLPDTRRLEAALRHMGVECVARYYRGEGHAFHAAVWREQSRRCWREMFAFLAEHVPAAPGAPVASAQRRSGGQR